jgi:hypothetical protein
MDDNPYRAPQEVSASGRKLFGTVVKYVVAALGAILVFCGAFLAIMLLPVAFFPVIYQSLVGVVLMYVVSIPLSILAAYSSFRGTLRYYARKP